MKRNISTTLLLCTALLGAGAAANAQSPYQVYKSRASDIEFFASNYGIFGLNVQTGRAGFAIPRGSASTYLFGAGLWFGARKVVGADTNALTFITYNPNSGASWAVPDSASSPAGSTEPLYNSLDYDRTTGVSMLSSKPAPWPLWLTYGQTAGPKAPGTFVPDWSDRHTGAPNLRPAFVPGVDEQIVARYNDRSLERYEHLTPAAARAHGYPLGLDIQENIYAWSSGEFKDAVLLVYEIVNTSNDVLYDCVAAQMSDIEIGSNTANDHASFVAQQPERRMAYAWTDSEQQGTYGVLGHAIIEGPMVDAQGYINNSARAAYRVSGRVGTFLTNTIEDDPLSPDQRYAFITNGGKTTKSSGDFRMAMATTTFNMRPGDTVHFTVLYGLVGSRPAATGGSELVTLVDAVSEHYYNGSFPLAVREAPAAVPPGDGIAIMPNPARDRATLRLGAGIGRSGTLRVVNSIGQCVIELPIESLHRNGGTVELDLAGIPAGLYLVSVASPAGTSIAKLAVKP